MKLFMSQKMSELISMDGYNDCIVGIVEQFGKSPVLCYDKSKIIAKLMSDGMSEEEAEEFFDYNQLGAYVGEFTPCFITKLGAEDVEIYSSIGAI
jgi:hypothetical protein